MRWDSVHPGKLFPLKLCSVMFQGQLIGSPREGRVLCFGQAPSSPSLDSTPGLLQGGAGGDACLSCMSEKKDSCYLSR